MPIFERFVRYEWAEYALQRAIKRESPYMMNDWLVGQGLGRESAHRTTHTLTWLWLPKSTPCAALQAEALEIFPVLTSEEHLALHWGMALCVFPSFHETIQIIGRLLRLQGEFRKSEVISRALERYGNQSTLKRAVERIIQTLCDWNVLKSEANLYRATPLRLVTRPVLSVWLYCCLMSRNLEHYWQIADLIRAPELFPFEVQHPLRLFHNDSHFTVHRDASGDEIVGLTGFTDRCD